MIFRDLEDLGESRGMGNFGELCDSGVVRFLGGLGDFSALL